MSPSEDTGQDPKERSKFSYSIEFLLSLAKTVSIELPEEDRLSISIGFEDGLLSPPFCDSDSTLDTSVLLLPPLKVTNKISGSLHRSNIPYCPPHRYMELYKSSGFPNSTRQQKGGEKRSKQVSHEGKSYADKAPLSQEGKRHVNKDKECDKSSQSFLLSPSSGNSSYSQSSSEATEQMDAPHKPCLIQEKSEACPNLNVGHPDRIPGVMEFHEKSKPPIFEKSKPPWMTWFLRL
ncbi:hypothetical protein QN277_011118 [Acacia crassicarpa]|uniref:Uncharacterized protein n=1 Tax=Acacia crassicarpa TaxID=499986 RepID=A0AAE1TC97_9FABA|nr:hypothetical protein QN277_011118 [Acacia crassicarpa]